MNLQIKTLSENIYRSLKRDIKNGKYPPNSSIPTEMELVNIHKVARGTVRKALQRLENEGFILKIRSRGTFVKDISSREQKKIAVVKFADCPITTPQHYILPGIEKAAAEAGIELVYYDIKFILRMNDPEGFKSSLQKLGVTGIISIGGGFVTDDPLPALLKTTDLPVVLPHIRYREDYLSTGFAAIRYEEKKGFTVALKHLIDRGHTRIGTIGDVDAKGLIRGYLPDEYSALLKRLGADTDVELLKIVRYDEEMIKQAVLELMQLSDLPSAILCYSDFWAFFVYDALKEISVKIPDDIAVMGFCGYPERNLFIPPLSTVDLMYAEHGKEALKLILESEKWYSSDDDTLHPEIVMPFKLVTEESTRPRRMVLS